ncbi:hypothetical protein BDZ91DRAFT_762332 [Kalaharituber pfeilii]|nr:hypothetical protein BDZ91DRAFT_762332 [Kalaharituber pfeilii]
MKNVCACVCVQLPIGGLPNMQGSGEDGVGEEGRLRGEEECERIEVDHSRSLARQYGRSMTAGYVVQAVLAVNHLHEIVRRRDYKSSPLGVKWIFAIASGWSRNPRLDGTPPTGRQPQALALRSMIEVCPVAEIEPMGGVPAQEVTNLGNQTVFSRTQPSQYRTSALGVFDSFYDVVQAPPAQVVIKAMRCTLSTWAGNLHILGYITKKPSELVASAALQGIETKRL